MNDFQAKMSVYLYIIFGFIIAGECVFLGPDPKPVVPVTMDWVEESEMDADGNVIWADANHIKMKKVWKEKPFDKKTDDINKRFWEGYAQRDYVFFGMLVLILLCGGWVSFFVFSTGIFILSDLVMGVLPKDVPVTESGWSLVLIPLVIVIFCIGSVFKRL